MRGEKKSVLSPTVAFGVWAYLLSMSVFVSYWLSLAALFGQIARPMVAPHLTMIDHDGLRDKALLHSGRERRAPLTVNVGPYDAITLYEGG